MANLFWKTKTETKALLSKPFESEADFEKTVFETEELLEDIYLLKRQVRGGGKSGIPDIVGVDADGNVCILEMKNVPVSASIIPQVLEYAFWAETNPDSIKSLWLEAENRPEDIAMSWEDLQVRILIIAPSILRSTLDLVDKINYPVDLIEVSRWVEADNQLLLVSKLEEEKKPKPKSVSGLAHYDDDFYKANYNTKSAEQFLRYVREAEKLVKENGWSLTTKFNKHYCGFKAGFFNAFGVKWIGSRSFVFFFKLAEDEATQTGLPPDKYEKQWKEAYYSIEPGKTKTKELQPLFEAAYRKLTGS